MDAEKAYFQLKSRLFALKSRLFANEKVLFHPPYFPFLAQFPKGRKTRSDYSF
jgi:hypothetical protein